MGGFADLELRIEREAVSFRVDGSDYEGPHRLAERMALDALWESGPEAYGIALFEALFGDGLPEEGFRAAVARVPGGTKWRMRLDLRDAGLHDIWWEALRDARPPHRKLAIDRGTPLSRYLPRPDSWPPVPANPLRVLVAISNPSDIGERWPGIEPIDEDLERATVEAVFEELGVEWETLTRPASVGAVRARLRDGKFHVLHLVGHGQRLPDGRGSLLLEDDDQRGAPIDEDGLGELVTGLDDSLRLVVLASCHGATRSRSDPFVGLAPRLVEYGVPAVVAMQDRVSADSARRFSRRFYSSLGSHSLANGMVDVAMNDARDELFFAKQDSWDWAIPVLFLRGAGRVFELPSPVVAAPQAAGPLLSPLAGAGAPAAAPAPQPGAPVAVDPALRMRLFTQLLTWPGERQLTLIYMMMGDEAGDIENATAEVRVRELLRWCEAGRRLSELEHVMHSLPAAPVAPGGGAA